MVKMRMVLLVVKMLLVVVVTVVVKMVVKMLVKMVVVTVLVNGHSTMKVILMGQQRPSFCFVLFCARNLYKVTSEEATVKQVSECRVSGGTLQRLSLNLLRIYMYGNEEAHA